MRRRETQCREEEKSIEEKEKKKRWRRVPTYLLLVFSRELAGGQGPPWSPCSSVPDVKYHFVCWKGFRVVQYIVFEGLKIGVDN
jgi:hypothetical protein